MIRKRWRDTSFDRHNEYCRLKGYDAAIIPNKPWHYRLRQVWKTLVNDIREGLARRLAPWLIEEES